MEKPRKILVVDDEPGVLRLFEKILVAGGYDVVTAENGKQALELMRKSDLSLVVLDISMPEPDGIEVLQYIRGHAPGLRVLAVSGFMGGALLEPSRVLGATAALNKADAPDKLLNEVNDLLKW